MTPRLLRIGASQSPVVVVDDVMGDVPAIVAMAAALAPFPPASGNGYPGVRRVLTPADGAGHGYATALLEAVAPFIGGAFAVDRFDWIEASFSMITAAPHALSPAQCMPHFDSIDPGYLAVLHYLSDTPGSGTAFYRQRATAIERVDAANRDDFLAAARRAGAARTGYIAGSDTAYERIGMVEARVDRVVIYQGSLLHSGIIPPDMPLNADPRIGRLTANMFVQARP
ncbi:hypothetical protein QE385_001680 [Sphingomonas sp. SORGH_AS 950]|uniref:DUF6445 family protein n=1 Tax=Sphingomonas sp. SORGH_AS_0950 TaxID=3041792 RepID=UPI00277DF182|nr:DUF6445 family protein [Sphingomonas sp. SORGH_AS_0950]MDQ1157353.1 hypothetical protein [Sphingomonas sp. SORGH_AS_0950]